MLRIFFTGLVMLVILLNNYALGQDYHLFKSDKEVMYRTGSADLHSLYFDSVVFNNPDSIYYNYRVLEELPGWMYDCVYNPNAFSWIGEKVIYTPEDKWLFFNKEGDTIYLRTLVALGDSFVFYRYPQNNGLVKAYVTYLADTVIYGQADQYKKITLVHYNINGLPMLDNITGYQLQISEKFGLLKSLSFKQFPAQLKSFYQKDFHRPTKGEIFDYHVGDLIEWRMSVNNGPPGYILKEIMDRVDVEGSDSIFYRIKKTSFSWDINGTYSYSIDTVWEKYGGTNQMVLGFFPHQYIFTGEATFTKGSGLGKSGRMCAVKSTGWISEYDTCYSNFVEPYLETRKNWAGLGSELFVEYAAGFYEYRNEIIAYKKGDEEWGSLLTFTPEPVVTQQPLLKLNPNPANQSCILSFANYNQSNVNLIIYNLLGQKIADKKITPNELVRKQVNLNTQNLMEGVYLIVVEWNESKATTKLVVKH